ncbi:hypothetical protein EYF80_038428 [Liparis tanakae]|uniref:Uncharacterized protein n=1 Tax=Liparis tanakae TaxID=230148 RepID=A0A4Z2GDX1_9TELE|nr:hypothetical protein EYF80_038428 [Liparis tanakae]
MLLPSDTWPASRSFSCRGRDRRDGEMGARKRKGTKKGCAAGGPTGPETTKRRRLKALHRLRRRLGRWERSWAAASLSDSSLANRSSSSCDTTTSLLEDTRSLPGLETSISDSEDGALPVGVRGGVSSRSAPGFRSAKPIRTKGNEKGMLARTPNSA